MASLRNRFGDGTRLRRFALDGEISVCVAEYSGAVGARLGALCSRAEVGVQLAGRMPTRWLSQGRERRAELGQTLMPGDVYDHRYQAKSDSGTTVWFVVHLDRLLGVDEVDRELVLGDAGTAAGDLIELAAAVERRRSPDAALVAAVRAEVRAHFAARCALSPADPVIAARKALEAHFDRPLYLHHVAAEVGVHPTVLLRRFARRYGTTPVQYRIKTRLNEASWRASIAPERSAAAVAADCGFDNVSYFHRRYRAYFGVTPGRHRAAA